MVIKKNTIRLKIFTGFLVVAGLILVVNYFSVFYSQKFLENSIGTNSVFLAEQIIAKIDRTIYYRIENIRLYSHSLLVRNYLADANQEFSELEDVDDYIFFQDREWLAASSTEITPLMAELINNPLARDLRRRTDFYEQEYNYQLFGEIFITNRYGVNIAQTNKTSDYYQADENWWQQAKENGYFVEDVDYDESAGIYAIALSVAVEDEQGNFLGVIKAVYNLAEIIQIIAQVNLSPYNIKHSHPDYDFVRHLPLRFKLLTADGRLIYQTTQFGNDYKILEPAPEELFRVLSDDKIPNYYVSSMIEPDNREILFAHAHSAGYKGFTGLNWILELEYQTREIFMPVSQLRDLLWLASLVIIVLSVLIGWFIARAIPYMALEAERLALVTKTNLKIIMPVLRRVAKGDFTRSIQLSKTQDEFSELLSGFNAMVVNLRRFQTAEKKITEQLKASEQMLKLVLDSVPVGIFWKDPRSNYLGCNQVFARDAGLKSPEEVVGKNDYDLSWTRQEAELYRADDARVIKSGRSKLNYEETLTRPDGVKLWVRTSKVPLKDNNGKIIGMLGEYEDITKFKGIIQELALEKNKAEIERDKINTIIKNIGDGVLVIDRDYNIIIINDVACSLVDCDIKRAVGKHYNKTLKFIDEKTGKTNDRFIKETIEKGKMNKMSNHIILVKKDGSEIPIADSSVPLKDKNGKIVGCVVVFRDITEERRAEKLKTEFVYIASHQLRTPLTGIKWFVELLLAGKAGKLNAKQKDFINQVALSNNRMIALVGDLLSASRIETGSKFKIIKRNVNIIPIIKGVLEDNIALAKERGIKQIGCGATPSKMMAKVDSEQIRQVFHNLITNAIKYSFNGGVVEISCRLQGKEIEFSVKDRGVGIPQNQQDKVFEKFFRADNVVTKETSGTGLGLYIAKAIVDGHGGRIWFESREGKGSTFYFTIPTV